MRLGVGHPGDKNKVPGYVLKDFAKADEDWLDDVIRGCSDGAAKLAAGDDAGFMNAVALRAAPQREKPAKQVKQPAPAAPADAVAEAPSSPFAKLLGKFGRS